MSASREKQLRREKREEGVEKRQVAERNNAKKKKRNNIITAVVAVILVLLVVVVVVLNSNLFYTVLPAVQIGDESYTTAEFNYYYYSSYYSFANSYGDYLSYFIDTSEPLEDQEYSDGQSWADYFQESAIETMRETQMLCDEAEAAGFTLPDESRQELSASLSELGDAAAEAGYTSIDQYIVAAYGRGCDYDLVSELMERAYLASAYYNEVYDSFEYTHDELDEYYTENANTYDYINYIYYYCAGTADEDNGIDEETAMANAEETVTTIKNDATDETTFADRVLELTEEEVTASSTQGQSITSIYSEFLLSDEREYGDCETFSSDYGWYVVMFLSRDDNHYNTVSVRHILIQAEADDDGNYTDEAKATALETLEGIYDEWESGDATEDSFAELANEYSEDSGSNTTGGLYEGIYQGQMVDEFNDFCFDESRQAGDTGIVYGESSSYAGYHLIYFVGEDDTLYSDTLADSSLRAEDYTAWQDEKLESYTASTKFAIHFAR